MASAKKAQRGYIYFTSGREAKVQPKKGTKFDYRELQEAVAGLITELIPLPKQGWTQMFANDEGLLMQLPLNPHTMFCVDMKVYGLNGYSRDWRVAGNIIGIKSEPTDENQFPTIAAAMKAEAAQRAG